jgi:hypothetical protein
VILASQCRAFGEGTISIYFKRLKFDAAGPSGARTHGNPLKYADLTARGEAQIA